MTVLFRMTPAVVVLLLVCLCGCMQAPADPGSTYRKGLQREAWQTLEAYNKALLAGTEKNRREIPPTYWAPEIQRLNPIKVYSHRVNLVVVQQMNGGNEQGLYLYLPVSSFMPTTSWWRKTGVDGFVFHSAWGHDVFHYTRTLVP